MDTLPQLLLALDDTVNIHQNEQLHLKISIDGRGKENKTIWFDLDKAKGDWEKEFKFCTKADTLVLNRSASDVVFTPVTNGVDTAYLALNFYENAPHFSPEYQARNRGKVQLDIPPVYELVHIAFALTAYGGEKGSSLINKDTYYYRQMIRHFQPYRDHPLIQHLQLEMKTRGSRSVFRDLTQHSMGLNVIRGQISSSEIYPRSYRISPWWGDLFQQLKDFADQTDYWDFYRDQQGYYRKLLHEQEQFLPIGELWAWLEKIFPDKVEGCQIIFSPLTGEITGIVSQSLPQYHELLLFVDAPGALLQQDHSYEYKRGVRLMSVAGDLIAFYLDGSVQDLQAVIKNHFSSRSRWISGEVSAAPEEIFRTYMSHSLFCLYLEERFPPDLSRRLRQALEDQMLDEGYIRFYAFSREFLSFYEQNKGQKKAPEIIHAFLQQLN